MAFCSCLYVSGFSCAVRLAVFGREMFAVSAFHEVMLSLINQIWFSEYILFFFFHVCSLIV